MASSLEAHLLSAKFHLQRAEADLTEGEKLLLTGVSQVIDHLLKVAVSNSAREEVSPTPVVAEGPMPRAEAQIYTGNYNGAEKHACPTCDAVIGQPCRARGSRKPQRIPHSARRNW